MYRGEQRADVKPLCLSDPGGALMNLYGVLRKFSGLEKASASDILIYSARPWIYRYKER